MILGKKQKKIYVYTTLIIVVIVLLLPVKIPYTVYGTGKIFARQQWMLGKTSDGEIITTIKNNQLSTITSYGYKEFQQRDVFNFSLKKGIENRKTLEKGEVVAEIHSTELERQLIDLRGQLKVAKAQLRVNSTGQKPEEVIEAETNLQLAEEKFNVQQKLFNRSKNLYEDSLISKQEFELAQNEFELAHLGRDLAEANLISIKTGEKPEEVMYAKAQIDALENNIENLEKRLEDMTVRAPFSGLMRYKKGTTMAETKPLVNLLDTSSYVITIPIKAKNLHYVKKGQKMTLEMFSGECEMTATVSNIDNSVQIANGKQVAYVTAVIEDRCPDLMPGLLAQAVIDADELTPFEYLKRMATGLFYR